MSEAETSSTGFRRGGKARSSLPVVRTPSKTLERPLGTVTEDLYHTQSYYHTILLSSSLTSFFTYYINTIIYVCVYYILLPFIFISESCVGLRKHVVIIFCLCCCMCACIRVHFIPLGMVFLQYRSETKRALLPNEITSMDTVKALFVRSFPKQLTMEYLDAMNVKIYIHDGAKDMFYELEDLR